MHAFRRGVPAVLVILLSVLLLKGSTINVSTGTWQPASNMSVARAGAIAVLVPDGRIVFTGGTDAAGVPTATAEAFSADGTFSALPSMSVARAQHAAIYTMTGDLLVTGGRTSGGGITNSAEIFDSLTNTWHSLPASLVEPRAGHTMSQLQNGNVLIAGGENSSGPVAAIEIYDITTGQFSFAGTFATARKGQAAAVLNDGRVLIIGGTTVQSDGTSATLASTEIYDPSTGQVTAGPSLATPRTNATATTLLDGRILVLGGSYPEGAASGAATELASAEIFDPTSNAFTASASQLTTARTGHLAFLLPNNNNVLIIGGTNSQPDATSGLVTTPLASAELYTPWTDTFAPTSPMSTARTAATGSALGNGTYIGLDGMLLIAGGTNENSAEVYGFATVKTDKDDYQPGSTVNITGGGWQPGETVTLTLYESPNIDTHGPYAIVADAAGNISNSSFSTDLNDLGVKFVLTAAGSKSQAQNMFSDATATDTLITSSQNPSAVGATVAFTALVTVNNTTTAVTVGNVEFRNGGNNCSQGSVFDTVALDGSGHASTSRLFSSSGAFTIRACYLGFGSGSSAFSKSDKALTQTVVADTTAPVITPNIAGALGTNGWYTTDVAVSWNVVDNESAISSSTGCTGTTTVATDTAGTTLTCTATSAGGTATQSVTIKRDASAPTASLAVTSGTLGANDWYTSDVTITASGSDDVSGPVTCTPNQFQTTNTSGTVFNGSCANQAGLTANAAPLTIMLDKTVPTATLSVTAGTAGTNGWYTSEVTVHTSGAGGPSNVECTADQFQMDETTGTVFNGYCTNGAGVKTDAAALTVKLDKTGPSATMSATGTLGNNGWYISNVTITTAGSDSISSPVTCTADQSLTSDTAGTEFNGSCTNDAGLTTTASPVSVKRDATAPSNVNANADRNPDHNDWYNHSLTVTWSGADGTSGIATCTITPYNGSDSATASLDGTCTDNAGNTSAPIPFNFKYDATGPSADLSVTVGTAGTNGWYTSDVTVHTSGSDPVSSPVTCTADQVQASETAGTAFNGSCTNDAGLTTNATALTVKLDKTGPSATLAAAGTVGNNGWYVTDVTITAAGLDSISSPVSCTAPQSLTLDSTGTDFNGSCTNDAGLTTNASQLSVKRDATAPTGITGAPNRDADHNGWYNHSVDVVFSGTDATSGIASCTTAPYNGPDSASATANGTCTDNAGNVSAAVPSLAFKYDGTVPSAGLAVTAGTPGTNGWYISDVTVSTSGSDSVSSPVTCTADQSQAAETAGVAFNGSCTNDAGLTANAPPLTVKLDKTGPSATLTPIGTLGNNGWYVSDVTVRASGADSISSPVVCTGDQSLTADSTGTPFNGDCTNNAGLTTNASTITVKLDKTKPTLNMGINSPATLQGGSYITLLHGSYTASANATDSTSGIASQSCGAVTTANVGTQSVSCTATDNAGNQQTGSLSYAVQYLTGGTCLGDLNHTILQPINWNGTSVFKQGSTTPAKFRVCDALGNSIGTPGVVMSFLLGNVVNGTIGSVDEAVDSTTPDSAFRWDPSAQQWIFNISTKPLNKNATYVFQAKLNDGTTIQFQYGLK